MRRSFDRPDVERKSPFWKQEKQEPEFLLFDRSIGRVRFVRTELGEAISEIVRADGLTAVIAGTG